MHLGIKKSVIKSWFQWFKSHVHSIQKEKDIQVILHSQQYYNLS